MLCELLLLLLLLYGLEYMLAKMVRIFIINDRSYLKTYMYIVYKHMHTFNQTGSTILCLHTKHAFAPKHTHTHTHFFATFSAYNIILHVI